MAEVDKTNKGKKLQGVVLKQSDNTTLKVRVEIKKSHPLYGKVVKSHKNYLVDNSVEGVVVGDTVVISETKPFSKNKKFVLVKKVSK
jgi:small subunit ribosomal protein S17